VNEFCSDVRGSNPFSTSRIRPGAARFLFPRGRCAEAMVGQLQANDWRGQILGPHGSGKSALVAALIPAIEQAGRRPLLIALHDNQRRMPVDWNRLTAPGCATVLIVDGYEQLGRWARFKLKRFCRRRRAGLLVTAHKPVGLPDLCRLTPDLGLAQKIVDQLLGEQRSVIAPSEVAECFFRHRGNLREMLFGLYDLYEQRRRSTSA